MEGVEGEGVTEVGSNGAALRSEGMDLDIHGLRWALQLLGGKGDNHAFSTMTLWRHKRARMFRHRLHHCRRRLSPWLGFLDISALRGHIPCSMSCCGVVLGSTIASKHGMWPLYAEVENVSIVPEHSRRRMPVSPGGSHSRERGYSCGPSSPLLPLHSDHLSAEQLG